MESGDIYRHERFYRDAVTGEEYPSPSFYLGVLGGPLLLKTWVDLRGLGDIDLLEVPRLIGSGVMVRVSALPAHTLVPLLECVARADDTTRHQERALRDLLTRLR